MKNIGTRLAAALAIAGLGLGVSAKAALAAPDTVDKTHAVSLTVHKLKGDPTNDPSSLEGLDGVSFTIVKFPSIDLSTSAGWNTLSSAMADGDPTNDGLATDTSIGAITTNAEGVAAISTGSNPNFTVGAYWVTETQKQGYTVAPPFLVTVPFSDANGAWNYDQNVYPKNQEVSPTKTVDDDAATIGKNLTYTINAPVPAGDLTRFVITDQLVSNLELQQPATVTATGTNTVALAAEDYQVTYDNNKLVVTFTQAGLTKLQNARKTDSKLQVHVQLNAKVVSLPANGQITNSATVDIPGGSVSTGDNGSASTTFAPLTITKTGPDGTANSALNGAVFEIYKCTQADGKWTLDGAALQVATTPIGDPAATITTAGGADGGAASTANAYGIPVSSKTGDSVEQNTYCALETKAPAGFLRNPEIQPVTYNAPSDPNTSAGTFTVSVLNAKDTIANQLPATGAWGLLIALVIGGGRVVRGIVTGRRDERATRA